MADLVAVAVGGGIGLAGTMLGVAVNALTSSYRDRRQFRLETALELAGMERLIWDSGESSYPELEANRQREVARLAGSGISGDLLQGFSRITQACWRSNYASVQRSDEGGIDSELLQAREAVHVALTVQLMKTGSRRARRRARDDALKKVKTVLPEQNH